MNAPRPKNPRGGQALIMASLSLMFLFTTMGLAVDLGWCYYLKSRVQTAADAAATAAAVWAFNNRDTCATGCGTAYACAGVSPATNTVQAGCLYATQDGPPTMTATLTENTTANASAGVSGNAPYLWVQATVSTSAPISFFYWAGWQSASISAQATAGISYNAGSSCVYILGTTASTVMLSITGSSTLFTQGCGVYVKSTYSGAINVTGSSSLKAGCNSSNNSCTGPISIGASSAPVPGGSSVITPAVTLSQTISDPLSTLAMPTATSCTAQTTNYTIGNGNTATIGPTDGSIVTYCGGISVQGAATLNLRAGTYVLLGGGLSVSNSGILNGTGVTFYNTFDATHTAGAISGGGSGVMNLTAPTTGTWQGMLFMQNPAETTAASFGNSAGMNVSGTYYFPTAAVSLSGSQSTALTSAFVVWSLSISGSSTLKQDTTQYGTVTGLPSHISGLIQ